MRFADETMAAADRLLKACIDREVMLVTAESCTGGLVAGCLTAVPGSSRAFERGFVTYSNEAKIETLGVPPGLIRSHGAVSREVAEAMAAGAIAHSRADLAAAVTGIAGPDGGSPEKPVGLVWIGLASRGGAPVAHRHVFAGDRADIRGQTVDAAIQLLARAVADGG